jgi:hypothetical protein
MFPIVSNMHPNSFQFFSFDIIINIYLFMVPKFSVLGLITYVDNNMVIKV